MNTKTETPCDLEWKDIKHNYSNWPNRNPKHLEWFQTKNRTMKNVSRQPPSRWRNKKGTRAETRQRRIKDEISTGAKTQPNLSTLEIRTTNTPKNWHQLNGSLQKNSLGPERWRQTKSQTRWQRREEKLHSNQAKRNRNRAKRTPEEQKISKSWEGKGDPNQTRSWSSGDRQRKSLIH